MFKIIIFLLILIVPLLNATAEEKYLSLPESEPFCTNHVLFKDRAATVIDVSGEKTELNKLVFNSKGRYNFRFDFPPCGSSFYIIKNTEQLSIPLNMILSIKFSGSTCEVTYKFMKEVKMVTGKYAQGEFTGEGDFGELNIQPEQVKEILFDKSVLDIEPPVLNCQLILNNGSVIPVREADMVTIDLYLNQYQDSMYSNVYHTDTFLNRDSGISFKKGVSDVSVPFKNIAKLDVFPEKGELSVTLKNGKQTIGKFISHDEKKKGTIDGFAGIGPESGFFVPIEHIREYRFGTEK